VTQTWPCDVCHGGADDADAACLAVATQAYRHGKPPLFLVDLNSSLESSFQSISVLDEITSFLEFARKEDDQCCGAVTVPQQRLS
jgi:hypothetical protein